VRTERQPRKFQRDIPSPKIATVRNRATAGGETSLTAGESGEAKGSVRGWEGLDSIVSMSLLIKGFAHKDIAQNPETNKSGREIEGEIFKWWPEMLKGLC